MYQYDPIYCIWFPLISIKRKSHVETSRNETIYIHRSFLLNSQPSHPGPPSNSKSLGEALVKTRRGRSVMTCPTAPRVLHAWYRHVGNMIANCNSTNRDLYCIAYTKNVTTVPHYLALCVLVTSYHWKTAKWSALSKHGTNASYITILYHSFCPQNFDWKSTIHA